MCQYFPKNYECNYRDTRNILGIYLLKFDCPDSNKEIYYSNSMDMVVKYGGLSSLLVNS